MHQEGAQMSEFTLSSAITACAAKYAIIECKQSHGIATKLALDSSSIVGTAVLDVYAECNMIKYACWIFEKIPEKTSVTWSSLFAGYVQNGRHEEALCSFQSAQREGVQLTEFTLSSILSSCASLALILEGTQEHAIIVKHGFHRNFYVATSLVDVYGSRNWESVAMARKYLKESGAKKEMGRSWIEAKGKIHVFTVGEREHPGITDNAKSLSEISIDFTILRMAHVLVGTSGDLGLNEE
ncbi:hypothetical protein ABZP36_034004 [Zizania latifolia]